MMSSVQLGWHLRVTWRVPLPAAVPAAWAALPGLRSRGGATETARLGLRSRYGAPPTLGGSIEQLTELSNS